jgi:hypothetical protein
MNNCLTMVTGFWYVKNKHDDKFDTWFSKTININCPYVIFGNEESINIIKKYRKDLPTHYINCEIIDFYTYQYIDKIQTHPLHCPSKELNMIWNEKMFLINKAKILNIFNSDYFAWIDAGICTFRDENPPLIQFPDINKLLILPKNKFIFTSSENPTFYPEFVNNDYYHHISAGIFIMHKSFINIFVGIYTNFIDELLPKRNWIYTEQVILTHMYLKHPNLFYKLTDGYGAIIKELY